VVAVGLSFLDMEYWIGVSKLIAGVTGLIAEGGIDKKVVWIGVGVKNSVKE
jgi:hypothetical protein